MSDDIYFCPELRGPTATPSDVGADSCVHGAQLRTSLIFQSEGVFSRETVVLLVSFCTHFSVGCVGGLQMGKHQYWAAHDVTVIKVPKVCEASVFSQSMPWIICSFDLFWDRTTPRCLPMKPFRVSFTVCANLRKGSRCLQFRYV